MTEEKIKELQKQFKGKGRIFTYGLEYLNDTKFFTNKQFDGKNWSVVTTTTGKSESVAGLFKTRKVAVEFGIALGLKEIPAPVIEPTFNV